MTREFSILGSFRPEAGVYESYLSGELTLTNAKQQRCFVFPAPSGADLGGFVRFTIPLGCGYGSSPIIVLKGYIDGTPANTIATTVGQIGIDISENLDQAYETEDLANNSTWTGYVDKDAYEHANPITPASAYAEGDEIFAYVAQDNSVDTRTWDFLVTDIMFRFTEA